MELTDLLPHMTYMTKTLNGETYKIINAEFNLSSPSDKFGTDIFDIDDIVDFYMDGISRFIVHYMITRNKLQFRFITDLCYSTGKGGSFIDDCYSTSFETIRRDHSFRCVDDKIEQLTDLVAEYTSTLIDTSYQITRFRVQIKTKKL